MPWLSRRPKEMLQPFQTYLCCNQGQRPRFGSSHLFHVMKAARAQSQVHQRVPLFVGSKAEVEYLESFF
jgi:hypothetical protein